MPFDDDKIVNNRSEESFQSFNQTSSTGGGKIGVSSNLVLDLTINPDFGQVEADPSELNLTSYETFFEEKRPFFLEGRDIFEFNLSSDFSLSKSQLFYSRRIGQAPKYHPAIRDDESMNFPQQTTILGAAKLTGNDKLLQISKLVHNSGEIFTEIGLLFKDAENIPGLDDRVKKAQGLFLKVAETEESAYGYLLESIP